VGEVSDSERQGMRVKANLRIRQIVVVDEDNIATV
jgi:hypothetical protein